MGFAQAAALYDPSVLAQQNSAGPHEEPRPSS
jgi:hypothetical protein